MKIWNNIVYWFIGDLFSSNSDYIQRAKILLVFYLPVGYSLLAVLNILLIVNNELWPLFTIAIIGLVCKIATPFVLKYTESLFTASVYFSVINFVQNSLSFISLGGELNLGATPYYLLQILYVAFLLGIRWAVGLAVAVIAFISTCEYLKLNDIVQFPIGPETKDHIPSIIVNVTVVTITLLFLLNQYSKTQRYSSFELGKTLKGLNKLNARFAESNAAIALQKATLQSQNEKIDQSIRYAKLIQFGTQHSQIEKEKIGQASFVINLPKDIVSGDFYCSQVKDNKWTWAVADCTGHGVPGALVSMIGNHLLRDIWAQNPNTTPGEILNTLSDRVEGKFSNSGQPISDGMDIALCKYDEKTQVLQYSGANNPLWILRNKARAIERIGADKRPIGSYVVKRAFNNHEIAVTTGDVIYLFSDGFPDQFGGERGKKYKYKPFEKFLISIQQHDLEIQKELLISEFDRWKGTRPQIDDVCIMAVKI